MRSNLALLPGSFDRLIDLIRFSLGYFLQSLSEIKFFLSFQVRMPSSTRTNKEIQLLFSSDPASLERSIRKGRRSSSIDNNTSLSLDSHQPLSTQTPISTTDTRSPPSLAHHRRPKTLFRRPISSIRRRSILQSKHRSILSRETWLRL